MIGTSSPNTFENETLMPIDESLQRQFEQCIDRNSDSLYRVAFRLTGHRDTARELVQESCLEAWENLQSIRDQTNFEAGCLGFCETNTQN